MWSSIDTSVFWLHGWSLHCDSSWCPCFNKSSQFGDSLSIWCNIHQGEDDEIFRVCQYLGVWKDMICRDRKTTKLTSGQSEHKPYAAQLVYISHNTFEPNITCSLWRFFNSFSSSHPLLVGSCYGGVVIPFGNVMITHHRFCPPSSIELSTFIELWRQSDPVHLINFISHFACDLCSPSQDSKCLSYWNFFVIVGNSGRISICQIEFRSQWKYIHAMHMRGESEEAD